MIKKIKLLFRKKQCRGCCLWCKYADICIDELL